MDIERLFRFGEVPAVRRLPLGIDNFRELVENGYFELCYKEGLSGWTLIFYSFLVDRARIDKYTSLTRKQMAGILKVNIKSIDQYLAKLSSLGLIERINDYKLKVYI